MKYLTGPIIAASVLALSACVYAREPIRLAGGSNQFSIVSGLVLKEVYRRAGVPLEIEQVPYSRGTLETDSGRLDGELLRIASYGAAHPNLMRVDPSFSQVTFAAYFRQSPEIRVKTVKDLAPYSVAYVQGVKAAADLSHALPDVQMVNSSETLAKMLWAGRVQIGIDDVREINFNVNKFGYPGISQVELARFPLHHYLHVRHRELVPVIGAQIRKLADSGELDKLFLRAERALASGESVLKP